MAMTPEWYANYLAQYKARQAAQPSTSTPTVAFPTTSPTAGSNLYEYWNNTTTPDQGGAMSDFKVNPDGTVSYSLGGSVYTKAPQDFNAQIKSLSSYANQTYGSPLYTGAYLPTDVAGSTFGGSNTGYTAPAAPKSYLEANPQPVISAPAPPPATPAAYTPPVDTRVNPLDTSSKEVLSSTPPTIGDMGPVVDVPGMNTGNTSYEGSGTAPWMQGPTWVPANPATDTAGYWTGTAAYGSGSPYDPAIYGGGQPIPGTGGYNPTDPTYGVTVTGRAPESSVLESTSATPRLPVDTSTATTQHRLSPYSGGQWAGPVETPTTEGRTATTSVVLSPGDASRGVYTDIPDIPTGTNPTVQGVPSVRHPTYGTNDLGMPEGTNPRTGTNAVVDAASYLAPAAYAAWLASRNRGGSGTTATPPAATPASTYVPGAMTLAALAGQGQPQSWLAGTGYGQHPGGYGHPQYYNEAYNPYVEGRDTKSFWYNPPERTWYTGNIDNKIAATTQLPWMNQPYTPQTGNNYSYFNDQGVPYNGEGSAYWYNAAEGKWYKGDAQTNKIEAVSKPPWM